MTSASSPSGANSRAVAERGNSTHWPARQRQTDALCCRVTSTSTPLPSPCATSRIRSYWSTFGLKKTWLAQRSPSNVWTPVRSVKIRTPSTSRLWLLLYCSPDSGGSPSNPCGDVRGFV